MPPGALKSFLRNGWAVCEPTLFTSGGRIDDGVNRGRENGWYTCIVSGFIHLTLSVFFRSLGIRDSRGAWISV